MKNPGPRSCEGQGLSQSRWSGADQASRRAEVAFFLRRFIQSRPARLAMPTLARAIVAGSGTAATRKPT